MNDIAFVASTLVTALNHAGHRTELVELPAPGAAWSWPWKAMTIPARAAGLAYVAARVRRADPRLVHVHYASQGILGWLSGRPYVVHCHGTDIRYTVPGSAWERAISPAINRAAGVLYSTPDLELSARRLRPDAVFLPNPVDTAVFRPGPNPERDVLVGIRLDAVKGAGIALEAIRRLVAARPATTVTIIRAGAMGHDLPANMGPGVKWISPVPHRDMPTVLGKHRIALGQFALGSIGVYELEALACGVPVVADFRFADSYSDAAPISPIDPGDRAGSAFAEMERLIGSPMVLRETSTSARQWAVRHHGLAAVAGRLLGYYRSLGLVAG